MRGGVAAAGALRCQGEIEGRALLPKAGGLEAAGTAKLRDPSKDDVGCEAADGVRRAAAEPLGAFLPVER